VAARIQSRPSARIDTTRRTEYLGAIQEWNARLIAAQRPIRVLEAVRWPDEVQRDFFARGGRELPTIGRDDYRRQSIRFDHRAKTAELQSLASEIRCRLGRDDPAARLLICRCRSYRDAARLIVARGTPSFGQQSRELYGSSRPCRERERLRRLIRFLEAPSAASNVGELLAAPAAAAELSRRLGAHFDGAPVRVRLVAQLTSDACAGSTYLKLRRDAVFTQGDIRLLEAHEGWAHLGTALNGRGQPILPVLGKPAPHATATQEGLAVFMEFAAGACHSQRRMRLASRLRAVMMAEDGADFLQVYRFLCERGHGEVEAYRASARVFRGALPQGMGPFTKDLSYGFGLLSVANRLRDMAADPVSLTLLFSGKVDLDEVPDLADLHAQGLLAAGEFIPPPFQHESGLQQALELLASLAA
jgi:uncharacterized protein (TIGR02421 family)